MRRYPVCNASQTELVNVRFNACRWSWYFSLSHIERRHIHTRVLNTRIRFYSVWDIEHRAQHIKWFLFTLCVSCRHLHSTLFLCSHRLRSVSFGRSHDVVLSSLRNKPIAFGLWTVYTYSVPSNVQNGDRHSFVSTSVCVLAKLCCVSTKNLCI